jgi:hypothetical protein
VLIIASQLKPKSNTLTKPIQTSVFLDPKERPWVYDCDGNRAHKGDYTKPWTEEDEQQFVEEYNKKLEK